MKRIYLLLIPYLFFASPTQAAYKYFQGYCFETSVISSSSGFEESSLADGALIRVRDGAEYSIVVRNPLPVRVAAAVTVDGLNTIDGKRTTPVDGQKWIIEPYSSITITGWQTSDSNARKFIFTRAGSSYAKWKENRDRKDYTANLGIIGVAFFWSSSELAQKLSPPQPFFEGDALGREAPSSMAGSGAMSKSLSKEDRAGTGMGRNEWNPVTRVNFYFDTGMYSPSDVLTIRYEFGDRHPGPMPFDEPRFEYRYQGNYSPQMP